MGSISSIFAAEFISQTTTSSGSGTQQSGSSNPFDQILQKLGSDLNNNDLSSAQSDFSQLEQLMQNNSQSSQGTSGTGHHHHAKSGLDELLQDIDSMLNSMQSDLTGSGTGTSSTTSVSAASISITA
jgi:outer membrane protein assembly factor BamD (BamD/ComL family)